MKTPPKPRSAGSRPGRRSTDELTKITEEVVLNGAKSFTKSSERIVKYLNENTPLSDWSVSRVTKGEQVHVHVHHDQMLETGLRLDWNQTFCSRMHAGAAHVVRDAQSNPDYSDLEAAKYVGAYVGYTIGDDRGELFGVLCGVNPSPLLAEEEVDEQLVRLLSDLLSTQLELSRGIDRKRRRIEVTEALAHSDALTGLLNRRGWDAITADAQERLDAFGDPVAVAMLDLDGLKAMNDTEGHAAGDALLIRTADTLRSAGSAASRFARYGGDEFVILANGVIPAHAEAHFEVYSRALDQAGIKASLGFAAAEPGRTTVEEAFIRADKMMYERKFSGRR